MINYKRLRYFRVVASQGGIARASERLHLTPPTISGQISLLEDRIWEALFSKAGRNLELTETGRLMLARVLVRYPSGDPWSSNSVVLPIGHRRGRSCYPSREST